MIEPHQDERFQRSVSNAIKSELFEKVQQGIKMENKTKCMGNWRIANYTLDLEREDH